MSTSIAQPTYSKQDCLTFIKNFRGETGKNPKMADVKALCKKKKCPSEGVFGRFGGLNFLIQEAGFDLIRAPRKDSDY